MEHFFATLMDQLSAAEQTSTAKLQVMFLKFKKRTPRLKVNKTKPNTENASC